MPLRIGKMVKSDEAQRLQELYQYNILFTDPEAAFDRITALAKRLFDVPIVLISLVETDFQWFKSCIGLNISSTSRELSFCRFAMANNQVFVIPDATKDNRFAENALVTGAPGIRFYAGAPLISPRGYGLGALCIVDRVPHPEGLSNDQQKALTDLASIVVSELELRSANELLNSVKSDLERSNKDLAKFAQIVSHDLQSPVRTIRIFTQLLTQTLAPKLADAEAQQLAMVLQSAERMGELISALLKYAEAGQAPICPENVSLADILASAAANLQSAIEENQAAIVHNPLPAIRGDRVQLTQLFQNLLSNALKYRSPERAPRVTVDCERHGEYWHLRIADNGIGMAQQDLIKIFEPLTRLHGSEIAGSGLGLAISRTIVKRHGGEISVASSPGVGTAFSFTLLPDLDAVGIGAKTFAAAAAAGDLTTSSE